MEIPVDIGCRARNRDYGRRRRARDAGRRLLRRYKLDELPRSEMSPIGPRPEVPCFVDSADPAWQSVHSVRPGITDLATLLYRDEEQILAGFPDPERGYREPVRPSWP